jgi:hypothetical protein
MANDRRHPGFRRYELAGALLHPVKGRGGHAAGEPPAAWSVEGAWSVAPAGA